MAKYLLTDSHDPFDAGSVGECYDLASGVVSRVSATPGGVTGVGSEAVAGADAEDQRIDIDVRVLGGAAGLQLDIDVEVDVLEVEVEESVFGHGRHALAPQNPDEAT